MSADPRDPTAVVRHEEEATLERRVVDAGSVRVQKHVDSHPHREVVERSIEHGDVERGAPLDGDSGEIETLPDGSISIPLFEEEIVVTKRLVVRERVIVRKRTLTETHEVEAELRRERVEVDADEGVEIEGAA